MMTSLRIVWYGEAALNLASAVLVWAAPPLFVAAFTSQAVAGMPLELLRWYGVLLFVLVYLELRALRSGSDVLLAVILEGLLVGDLIQLVTFLWRAPAMEAWTAALIFTIVVTIALATARIVWLTRHARGLQ